MANWNNEAEAREQIKALVAEYYHDCKKKKASFKEGDRISYASRVFDEKELQALTDAIIDFWLTTGRFSNQFEKEFASWIGIKYAHLVNSGYNIGGTIEQSLSLLELFAMLEDILGIKMAYTQLLSCQSDQEVFVADIKKIQGKIGWTPKVSSRESIESVIEWVKHVK